MAALTLAFLGDPGSVHVRRWLGFLVRQGHAVHLLVDAEHEAETRSAAADPAAVGLHGVRVVGLVPYPRSRIPFASYLEARAAMRNALREIRPDLLHAHYLTGYGWRARVSGFLSYAVTTWGSDVYRTAPSSVKGRLFARLTLAGADLVSADSRDLADATIRLGARRQRVQVVQFGVDTDRSLWVLPQRNCVRASGSKVVVRLPRRRLIAPQGRLAVHGLPDHQPPLRTAPGPDP